MDTRQVIMRHFDETGAPAFRVEVAKEKLVILIGIDEECMEEREVFWLTAADARALASAMNEAAALIEQEMAKAK